MRSYLPALLRERFDPAGRYGLRLTLFAISILLVAIPFGLLLAQVRTDGPLTRFDAVTAERLHRFALDTPGVVPVSKVVSFLGLSIWVYPLLLVASVRLWTVGRRRLVGFLLATAPGGQVLSNLVKEIVDRPRPVHDDPIAQGFGQSFPSGHALNSVVFYGALLLVFLPVVPPRWRRPVLAGTVMLAVLVGASRLTLGVHYVTDVLAGYALGLAWLVASVAAFSIWRREEGKPPVEPIEGVEPEAEADLTS
ncbi:MAG: phosphatase PAP2 family protein [Actinomycetota bacterium]